MTWEPVQGRQKDGWSRSVLWPVGYRINWKTVTPESLTMFVHTVVYYKGHELWKCLMWSAAEGIVCRKYFLQLKTCLHGISELRSVTCHMGSHSVTCHPTQVSVPRLHSIRHVEVVSSWVCLRTGTSCLVRGRASAGNAWTDAICRPTAVATAHLWNRDQILWGETTVNRETTDLCQRHGIHCAVLSYSIQFCLALVLFSCGLEWDCTGLYVIKSTAVS